LRVTIRMPMPTLSDQIPSEQEIRDFWDTHPCGHRQVQSLKADYEAFFERYDNSAIAVKAIFSADSMRSTSKGNVSLRSAWGRVPIPSR